jgi:hypothetical protein
MKRPWALKVALLLFAPSPASLVAAKSRALGSAQRAPPADFPQLREKSAVHSGLNTAMNTLNLSQAAQADQGTFHVHPISLRHRPGRCAVQRLPNV